MKSEENDASQQKLLLDGELRMISQQEEMVRRGLEPHQKRVMGQVSLFAEPD
jgi:hypothetical protein